MKNRPTSPATHRAAALSPAHLTQLKQAQRLHAAGSLDQAEALYVAVHQSNPDNPDVCHLLGLLHLQRHQIEQAENRLQQAARLAPSNAAIQVSYGRALHAAGKPEQAVQRLRQAIKLDPASADGYFHLARTLVNQSNHAEAVPILGRLIALQPNHPLAHFHLGNALLELGRGIEAVSHFQKTIKLKPDFAEARHALGLAYRKLKRDEEAADAFAAAVALKPTLLDATFQLGRLLKQQNKMDAANNCYRKALECFPNNRSLQHLLASVEGASPACAPPEYVVELFDDYADKFDSHLVEKLGYQGHSLLAEQLLRYRTCNGSGWDILDLGCGTGLFGAAIKEASKTLTGIDLSAKMLAKAEALGLYHTLEQEDIQSFMAKMPSAGYDVISSTDVFIYVGQFEEVFRQSKRLLRSGGLFAYCVESLSQPNPAGYALAKSGRFKHNHAYLQRLAAEYGFVELDLTESHIRKEQGEPVPGWYVILQSQPEPA